jgi:hypothetical protein
LPELLLPDFGLLFRVDQRSHRSGHDWDIGPAGDFDGTQGPLRLFFDPLVADDERDTEHLDIGRLQEQQDRLHVRARRSAGVLVDDHLAALRGGGQRRHEDQAADERP